MAIRVCDEALAAHPEAVEVRFARLLLTIPAICTDADEMGRVRVALDARLGELELPLAQASRLELVRSGAGAECVLLPAPASGPE